MPQSLTESPKSIGQINKLSKNFKPSEHYVSFELKERIQRMCMWVNQVGNLVLRQKSKSYFLLPIQNFLLPCEIEPTVGTEKELLLQLCSLRNQENITLHFQDNGQVKFYTSNIKLAGIMIQSICKYLNVEHLNVILLFIYYLILLNVYYLLCFNITDRCVIPTI